MRMNLAGHVASGHFVLGRDILCEFDYCKLTIGSKYASKVCLQCKAAIPVRWKTCERCDLIFRFKRKRSVICERNSLTMKRMGAVESDSVKSARKDKLQKACETVSETREQTLHGQEQNNVHGKHESVTRQFLVNRQVQSHALLR